MNGKQVFKKLIASGWWLDHIMTLDGRSVSVPVHGGRDLKPGLISGLQKQTGMIFK
jgi:predicted RNA binding protein YcfA (HicA-like mRNA interferase family)